MSSMHEQWTERLSEYLDGALGWDDQLGLETHLDECSECSATLAELRRVVARADGLEDRPPTRELWAGIVERIEAESRTGQQTATDVVDIHGRVGARANQRPWQRRFSFSIPQLAAAGIATVLMSAGAAWVALASRGEGPTVAGAAGSDAAAVASQSPSILALPPSLTLAGTDVPLITKYETAIEDLEEALRLGEGNLEPETVATLRHSLAVIDRAIDEARTALAADPGSAYLNTHLADTMRRKMDLLRYANYFATAQS